MARKNTFTPREDLYSMGREELDAYYRKVAAAADARLRNLEKYAKEDNYKVADKWAYASAMRDIHRWNGENAKRFNTKPPANMRDLQKKVAEIENFMLAETSTKGGIREHYESVSDKINKDYGLSTTWSSMGDFFENEVYKKLEKEYGSGTVMKALGYYYRNADEIKRRINEELSEKVHVSGDDADDLIRESLEQFMDAHNAPNSGEKIDAIMTFLGSEEPTLADVVNAANAIGIEYPAASSPQTIRNLKKFVRNGGEDIKWEELFRP